MAIEEAAPTTEAEKEAAITAAIKDLDKSIGPKSVIRMRDVSHEPMPVIPTGILALDQAVLGTGGMPRGRIIEVFGPESSGKTSIALATIAAAQANGGRTAFIDAEHAFDPTWATTLGVSVDDMLVSQPDTAEGALQIVLRLVESRAIDVIVVDSVAALVPKAEMEGDMGNSNMGLQARLMNQAMRKLVGPTAKAGVVLIFINQIREKIGVMFGSPEVTTGGRGLKFAASVRLDIRRLGAIKEGEVTIGFRTKIKGVKNKVSAPFKEAEVELYFASGFDRVGPLVDAAVVAGVLDKSGSWYAYKGERIGQGRASVIKFLTGHELFNKIKTELESKLAQEKA